MKAQEKARTPVQRKADRRWARALVAPVRSDSRPLATYAIMALTALTFLIVLIPGVGIMVRNALLLWPPLLYPDVTGTFEPWRLFTVSLVHAGFWHLGLNMLALWMIGRSLEPLLGRVRFVAMYLICALGGSVGVVLLSFDTVVVGASGAVFGLFGALLVIGRHLGTNVTGIAVVIGINLIIGFIPGFNVSWQAHVGGLVTGVLVGLTLVRTRKSGRRGIQTGTLIALTVGLLALLLIPAALY